MGTSLLKGGVPCLPVFLVSVVRPPFNLNIYLGNKIEMVKAVFSNSEIFFEGTTVDIFRGNDCSGPHLPRVCVSGVRQLHPRRFRASTRDLVCWRNPTHCTRPFFSRTHTARSRASLRLCLRQRPHHPSPPLVMERVHAARGWRAKGGRVSSSSPPMDHFTHAPPLPTRERS